MNTENTWAVGPITPATIDAIMRQARVERAEVMRAELAALPAKVMRLVGYFRPIRQHKPQTSAFV